MTEIETSQSFNFCKLKETLEEAGYKLNDYGDHWRTAALYRGGNNPMSLKIYKNSGVWSDFGYQNTPLPAAILLSKIFGPNHPNVKLFKKNRQCSEISYYTKTQKIEMDKIYPESILQNLFPNFHFYAKKGFSQETLQSLRAGLAGTGKMYRRVVFPIYDENAQIIGFSGRKIDEDNQDKPKWKHIGNKRNWVYPTFVPSCKDKVEAAIEQEKCVILVESIGDMMALHENGIYNVIVTFGLKCSPALISFFGRFLLERIIIVANNDKDNKKNNGMIGAVANYVDLCFYFNPKNIKIQTPPNNQNDLGVCCEKKINLANWYQNLPHYDTTKDTILKFENFLPAESKKKLKKIQS